MSQRIRSLGALRRAATHLREPQGSAGEQGWLAAKVGTSVRRAELCAPDDAIATRPGRPLIMRASRSAFGMNTTSSHEFEFEYGEFGVFKFMIIRRHSIQTHDNFAVKNS